MMLHLRATGFAPLTLSDPARHAALVPDSPTRKRRPPFDPHAYKPRNLIERMFCRLKDGRRIATRYDKLAPNFAAVTLAAALIGWI